MRTLNTLLATLFAAGSIGGAGLLLGGCEQNEPPQPTLQPANPDAEKPATPTHEDHKDMTSQPKADQDKAPVKTEEPAKDDDLKPAPTTEPVPNAQTPQPGATGNY